MSHGVGFINGGSCTCLTFHQRSGAQDECLQKTGEFSPTIAAVGLIKENRCGVDFAFIPLTSFKAICKDNLQISIGPQYYTGQVRYFNFSSEFYSNSPLLVGHFVIPSSTGAGVLLFSWSQKSFIYVVLLYLYQQLTFR
jgi:hypothetical protein